MVIVYTGMEELDKAVADAVNGKQGFYADYLLEEKEADTVITSTNIETKIPLKDFLFALRRDNKRVILLVGDEKSPYIGYALALGIYDLVFDPVTIDAIAQRYKNPARFTDVAQMYLGLRSRVSFEDPVTKTAAAVTPDGNGNAEIAKEQLKGIFRLMGKTNNKENINEMLLDLEQILIQQII
ncbi:hypothetical protein Mahau_2413 [Mahella australiensis 50-1 BON]|jgi:hypothetical protein|uniref:Response regulator receiver protein n=2 Tax=Mahella TaxID=252965 RepID=F3ZWV4_MAHA5|nr:hypothetical protein Mahau_2413 [Mahella australiensis 50-1 BON]